MSEAARSVARPSRATGQTRDHKRAYLAPFRKGHVCARTDPRMIGCSRRFACFSTAGCRCPLGIGTSSVFRRGLPAWGRSSVLIHAVLDADGVVREPKAFAHAENCRWMRRRSNVEPCRSKSGRGRQLEGYAASFGIEARIGKRVSQTIRAGAFAASLRSGRDMLALIDHDPGRVPGRTRSGRLGLSGDARGRTFWRWPGGVISAAGPSASTQWTSTAPATGASCAPLSCMRFRSSSRGRVARRR
ncbi:HK97 family phage prohead protease [Aureimonas sp. D3]|uniref:HK97 family phage prohead protease n=1 Tax=Aureimonas sp. D3 TaxID=1638164 RepID=UPI000ACCBA04|nr:HK97 family phage prohead protease [Aureimonas sp. D3]